MGYRFISTYFPNTFLCVFVRWLRKQAAAIAREARVRRAPGQVALTLRRHARLMLRCNGIAQHRQAHAIASGRDDRRRWQLAAAVRGHPAAGRVAGKALRRESEKKTIYSQCSGNFFLVLLSRTPSLSNGPDDGDCEDDADDDDGCRCEYC